MTPSLTSQTDLLKTPYWVEQITAAWQALQHQQPLIHYISNSVAANYVANVLLAAGASPALIDNPFEAAAFTQISAALNINLGTPTSEQMQAMRFAAQAAHDHLKPWVLDPVGYGAVLSWRSKMIDELLTLKPTIIRGNASEIGALAGRLVESKGVDSTLASHAVTQQAQHLLQYSQVIAISGESDFILCLSEDVMIEVQGGSALQPKVTATGCALGGLIAAYAAVAPASIATVAAHNHFAIAGKLAAAKTQSIGSFNVAFLDAIYEFNAEHIAQHTSLSITQLHH